MTALSKTFKAAVVALALGGSVMTAMPVQAQPAPSFNFQFGTDGFRFGIGDRDRRWRPGPRRCLTDPQVRRDLRRDGYDRIRFIDRRGRVVQVLADRGRQSYRIAFDTCRGRIIDRDRVRRR